MKKRYLFILIVLLAIGFASVTTTLVLNGTIGIGVKLDDFNVIFIEALLNGEYSEKVSISEDKKSIIFKTDRLSNLGDSIRLDYKVKNTSTQYGANVIISCNTYGNENIGITGKFANIDIPLTNPIEMSAQEIKSGYLNAELIQAYVGEDTSISIECKLVATATSKDNSTYTVNFDSNGGSSISDKLISFNENYGELPIPTKENYVFLGWYTEDDVKINENTVLDIKSNQTLKAKWTPVCPYELGKVWDFAYTGTEQLFNTPCLGNYKIEVWGAQGGASNSTYIGGYGGYAKGVATLDYDVNTYINVGGKGETNEVAYSPVGAKGGYNGGGTSIPNSEVNHLYGAGGGATHVALKSGLLSTLENYVDKILIVAGGGGGGRWQSNFDIGTYGYGGHGGGYLGVRSSAKGGYQNGPLGGAQEFVPGAGSFGKGADILANSAGGGGYYGGGTNNGPASGGSGYIANRILYDKVMYCYECPTSNEEQTKTISTNAVNSSPISNNAKLGDGFARITLISFPY